jgi:perosamine synthetase
MESGWLSQGVYVEQAEEELRRITGRKYAICASNGTTALLASLMATRPDFGWRHDEEVCVPAFAFAAVHNVVDVLGLIKVFQRSDPETWQVSDERWEKNFDNAVLVATCYGKVQGPILQGRQVVVINDVAESFGGTRNGFPAAAYGTIACCSFYANKIVVAGGEGGAIFTDDDVLAEKIRTIINHGTVGKSYAIKYIGINGRMTNLSAAVLCAQLDRMPDMVLRRRQIMSIYRSAAAGRGWTFPAFDKHETPAPWLFAGIHTDIASVQRHANEADIEWRPFFPIPKEAGEMKETRFISENGICLPLSSTMTDGEVNRVCEVIRGS